MALARFGAFSVLDAARELSFNLARAIGLLSKGHFAPGADADVTLIDLLSAPPVVSLVTGHQVMIDGRSVAKGGAWLVTPHGARAAAEGGLRFAVVDIGQSRLYSGQP